MQVDKAPMGRTLRNRKERVVKHLKRAANEKEIDSFLKRVLRIPLEKPFEEAYFTHRLWMFFRETKETEEVIRRIFHEARNKMKNRITLKKKSDPGKFAIPCLVKCIEFPHALCDRGTSISILPRVMANHLGLKVEHSKESFTFVDCSQRNSWGIVRDLEVQIGNALVLVDFHVLDIKLNWNSSLLLRRAFLSSVGAVCNMKTNQLCLTLIDPHDYYDPIPVIKPQTSSRRIDDPRLTAACHCGAEYETEYSASIETHIPTSTDSSNQKSIDNHLEESIDNHLEELIDSSPDDVIEYFPEGPIDSWENNYYSATFAVDTATSSDRANLHTEEYDEDYKEERATEYRGIRAEKDRLLHYSYGIRHAMSIDMTIPTSINTHHY
ncbi:hypothetical protein F2Q68_00015572 [Brassica cretica]|uniref:Aspartic peptidase DDI1-type domain-containing protein n=2 Tax=Brassica cretica TaxID=69181 RepID=A0ABQ7F6U9_BRACR|nr:hypothetical protein F2Q68_00015572 [Brassica cretica]KAF3610966.1 hypothetical protein DY000_02048181 [Brassica cretica]